VLWAKIPVWLYVIVVASAFVQLLAWYLFIRTIRPFFSKLKGHASRFGILLLIIAALACTVKLVLQLGSTIPVISKLAFGFRPIVIAYLHLVLLGVITVFILGFSFSFGAIKMDRVSTWFAAIFVAGIIINEFLLLLQGIGSFAYYFIPYSNQGLFMAALIMMLGLLGLWSRLKMETH